MFYEPNLVFRVCTRKRALYTAYSGAIHYDGGVQRLAFSIHGPKVFKQKYLPLDAIKVYIILYTPATRQELYL